MRNIMLLFLIICVAMVCGCTTTQKGAGLGAVTGAGLGAIIGHQSGHGGEGAAIGAAVGGLGGALIGEQVAKKFCPVCGATYPGDVQYCPKDGTQLEWKK
ncbi:MAG: YMGG-like glycine zipper-containing protein [Candidatus Omnitrophota bacterium]